MHASPVLLQRFQASAVKWLSLSVFAAALIGALPALAEAPAAGAAPSTSWSLGLGGMSRQQPYAGIDRENRALPLIKFENDYVRVFGPAIEFKLPGLEVGDSQQLNFNIVGKYDNSGYESGDAAILRGMSERKSGFLAGAKIEWNSDWMDVSAEWLTDVSGNSDGQLFSLGAERTWHISDRIMLTPRVGATWHDKTYNDYYFGVRDSEVRMGRSAYSGRSGVNAEVGARAIYRFDKRHSVFLDVEVVSLAKGIKDSPLVDRSTENRVLLGYLYRFR